MGCMLRCLNPFGIGCGDDKREKSKKSVCERPLKCKASKVGEAKCVCEEGLGKCAPSKLGIRVVNWTNPNVSPIG